MSNSPEVHALLIDDDAGVLFYHKMMLTESSLNVEVFTFDKGTDAIEYIEEEKDNDIAFLIFLDISMPSMNGWEFIKHLEEKGLTDNIYIVVVTASMNEKDEQRALSYPNVVHYTDKPISQSTCNNLRDFEAVKHLFK